MALEIRILGGARAGQRELFEKPVVAIGRHPLSDLRFDPDRDLDVSTRHAEIRAAGGRYVIHDHTSTNGTFVNGERALPDHELHDGDRIAFGTEGPQVVVHFLPEPAPAAPPPRRPTTERIALAVQAQTARLTRLLVGVVIVLGAGIGVAFWMGHRASARQVQQLEQMLAQNESALAQLNARLQAAADTSYGVALEARGESLRARVARAPAGAAATVDSLRAALRTQHALVTMDVPAINARNAPAVALLYAEIKGRTYGGTAFAVTPGGLLVTDRHDVQDADGTRATRLAVTFRDTKEVWPAHVVKVSDDPAVDLALVQVERGGPFPVVSGIAPAPSAAPEGAPVVTIGFPLATDLPMEGSGSAAVVKTTLDPGTVSKRVTAVLQIDAYATHGSSGSPVFNADGNVVGVVYGGPSEGGGRIVYAVPGDRLAAFLPAELQGLIR